MNNYKQLLIKILLKKAKGYATHEKTEEFALVDGEVKLLKRKVVSKKVPPDVTAIKALLELDDNEPEVTQMTDEQLAVEKLRLLRLLQTCDQTVDNDIQQE